MTAYVLGFARYRRQVLLVKKLRGPAAVVGSEAMMPWEHRGLARGDVVPEAWQVWVYLGDDGAGDADGQSFRGESEYAVWRAVLEAGQARGASR